MDRAQLLQHSKGKEHQKCKFTTLQARANNKNKQYKQKDTTLPGSQDKGVRNTGD